jgi:hypothetical protein
MPAKKQKQPLNYNSDTVTIDSGYGAVPYITSIGTDTITLDNTLWSSGSITSPYVTTTTVPNGGYTIASGAGAGTYNWNNTTPATVQINTDGLTMTEGTDIKLGGHSLKEFMSNVEERLGILHPNPALEERWDKLKDLRRQYMEMEKDILEKEKIMKILKEA